MVNKILGRITGFFGIKDESHIEDYLDSSELGEIDMFHQTAERYVVPVALVGQEDVTAIKKELSQGNLVLVNFEKIKKLEKKVTKFAADLHAYADSINGDIARVGADKLLMTPSNAKIIKRKITLKRPSE